MFTWLNHTQVVEHSDFTDRHGIFQDGQIHDDMEKYPACLTAENLKDCAYSMYAQEHSNKKFGKETEKERWAKLARIN